MADGNALCQAEMRPRHHQRYLHPKDGRLIPLVVQSSDDPRHLPRTTQWTRMGPPASQVPSLLRAAYWIGSSTIQEGTAERIWTPKSLAITAVKMTVASPVMYCLMSGLDRGISISKPRPTLTVDFTMDLRYDRVFTRDPIFDHTARPSPDPIAREEGQSEPSYLSNIRLNSHVTPRQAGSAVSASWVSRTESAALSLRPRYLCFVKDFDEGTYETVQISDYISEHGEQADTEFVFVSYTRMQFRVATDEEINAYEYPDEETREANRKVAAEDREKLIRWAIEAAHAAGKRAFWLDFECVRDADGLARSTSSSEDVYRICDIVRASHSMIIGIGPPVDERIAAHRRGENLPMHSAESQTRWLRQWGSRLWTLPELLLCPSEYRIKLYVAGDSDEPRELAKRNFAERAWDDADTVKDLVNHYEGSAILSPLLLMATALECFSRRKTDQFSPGDIAYAIMGLLPDRQRPTVDQEDSGFQAFARLSLAHGDGRFLERLICLLPPRRGAKWFETNDLWGARLKDILPNCQVVEVGSSDSIILDGAFGGTIHWDGIDGTASFKLIPENALGALFAGIAFSCLLPKAWMVFLMLGMKITGHSSHVLDGKNGYLVRAAGVALVIPFVFAFIGPMLVLWRSKGGTKDAKSYLIGIEGFLDVTQVERYLWGHNFGLMAQTSTIPIYRDTPRDVLHAQPESEGLEFTLVDTNARTVTHFRASRPPVAMFVCGQEGGLQRALLCSYDADSNTYCRETVLKVHSKVLEQMRRVEKFRFALEISQSEEDINNLQMTDDIAAKSNGVDGASEAVLDDGKRSLKLEWSFFLIALMGFHSYCNFDTLIALELRPGAIAIPYSVGFILSPLIPHIFPSSMPLSRLIPNLALLKGLLVCLKTLRLDKFESYASVSTYAATAGVSDGACLAVFVVFCWSWFDLVRLPLRMLIWTCGLMVAAGVWHAMFPNIRSYRNILLDLEPFFYALLFFAVSLFGWNLITTPDEVMWLDAHKRVLYERRSAAYKWETRSEKPERASKKHPLLSRLQPWLFCMICFLNAATALPVPDGRKWTPLNAFEATLMLLLPCLVLFKLPQATALMGILGLATSLIISIVKHLTNSSLVFVLMRSQMFVTPLIWAMIVSSSSTRSEGHWSLRLSLVGHGAGRLVGQTHPGISWTAPIMAMEIMLIGYTWFLQHRTDTEEARAIREMPIGEEYRDDVEDM